MIRPVADANLFSFSHPVQAMPRRAGKGIVIAYGRGPSSGFRHFSTRGHDDVYDRQTGQWCRRASRGRAYPFWALTIIAVDVVALYGLCAYGSRKNLEAV
jgi:hypothetical protein